ncbi:uncharacterized protein ChrSV_p0027 (plasmid) [Chromobacterium vaccinii]|nr:uncharacterized protein ChrSW_p0027 [Chromobacterium vaccinii]QND87445.1 uncharacterized protein ChrSV_p0027 [Chromobacterium vaccinii]
MTLFAFPSEQTRLEALRTRLKLQFQHGALPTQEDYYLLINLLCDCVLVAQSLQARPAPPETIRVSADDPLFLALEQRDEEVEQRLQRLQTQLDGLAQAAPAVAPVVETVPDASSAAVPEPDAVASATEAAVAGETETIGNAAVGSVPVSGAEPAVASVDASAEGEQEAVAPRQDAAPATAVAEALAEANPSDTELPQGEAEADDDMARIAETATTPEPTVVAEAAENDANPVIQVAVAEEQAEQADATPSDASAEDSAAVAVETVPELAPQETSAPIAAADAPEPAPEQTAAIATHPESAAALADAPADAPAPVVDAVPESQPAAEDEAGQGKAPSALRRLFDTLRGQ